MKRRKANLSNIINKGSEFLNNLQSFTNGVLYFLKTFEGVIKEQQIKNQESPYTILGVSEDDPEELIKEIYRTKSKYYHPDKKGGDNEKFIKMNTAYKKILKLKKEE